MHIQVVFWTYIWPDLRHGYHNLAMSAQTSPFNLFTP